MEKKGKNEVLADRYSDALMRFYSGEKLNCATWMNKYNAVDCTFHRDINCLDPIQSCITKLMVDIQ